jgi:oligosaccharide repeat unit polymerase
MLLFCLSACLLLFVIFKISHDLFHPAFISVFIWLLVVMIYNFVIFRTHLWHGLSGLFYIYVFIYLLCFSIFALSVTGNKFSGKPLKINLGIKFVFLQICCFILIGLSDLYLLKTVRQVGMSAIRDELVALPIYAKLASYATPLELILFCYGFSVKKSKVLSIQYYLCFLLVILQIFLMASKGGYFQILICLVFLLYEHKKLTKKTVFFIGVVFLVLIFSLQFARGGGNDKMERNFLGNFLYTYFLSPLPALDLIFTGEIDLSWNMFGGGSLSFIYRFLTKLGITPAPQMLYRTNGWVAVPYLTNVFTILGNYYMDFGILGLIALGVVYGTVFGVLYSKIRFNNSIYSRIFYALWLYCLVFQFFGDWFFGFFSVTLQSAFWLFVVTHRFKSYSLRYRR